MSTKSPHSTATETSASAHTVSAFIRYSRVTLRASRIAISISRLLPFCTPARSVGVQKGKSRRHFSMSQYHYYIQKYLGPNIAAFGRCDVDVTTAKGELIYAAARRPAAT